MQHGFSIIMLIVSIASQHILRACGYFGLKKLKFTQFLPSAIRELGHLCTKSSSNQVAQARSFPHDLGCESYIDIFASLNSAVAGLA